jgi:protein O-GlcNAc transferase
VTFGSFNIVAKITATTLDVWAGVLRAVPRSRLLLKAAALAYRPVRERLVAELGARGVDADRIAFREWQTQGHLEAYGELDIALDTSPFNGATTTCEALWMGVPVIAERLAGDLGELQAIRDRLRTKLRASPLLNGKGFARAFEQAVREIANHPGAPTAS